MNNQIFSDYLKFIFLTIVISLSFPSCKEAPSDAPEIITKITGKVTDGQTNDPLDGVQITTNPVTSSVVTGADGNYTIPNVSPGQYTITYLKDGYNDNTTIVTVAEGQTIVADIQLIKLGPELAVSVQNLDFDVAQTNITFAITNKTNIGTVTWQIVTNEQWMTISPTSGTTSTESDLISVSVSRAGLNYGNYSGTITINSDYGTKQISVLMVIQNPSAPQLTITPIQIDFGTTNNNQTVTVKNTGTGTLNWNASVSENWILLSASSGSSLPGIPSDVNVSVDRNGLVPNIYEGTVSFTSNGGNQNLIVKMEVEQGTLIAPTLQIIGTPTDNSISMGWTKVIDPTFANYKIYSSILPGVSESSTLVTTITDPNQINYIDSGLNDGTTYYYRVFVYSASGIGSGSNEVSATTLKVLGTWFTTLTIPNFNTSTPGPNILYALSENNVWLVSGSEIWHFDGSNWGINFTGPSVSSFRAIFFVNENLGWTVDYNGYVFSYNGITWNDITNSVSGILYTDVVATSANDIWISGNELYHFDGNDWTTYSLSAIEIRDLDILASNRIWALSQDGTVFKYNGIGWALIENIPGPSSFQSISVVSDDDIWVANSGFSSSGLWHYDGVSFKGDYKLPIGSSGYQSRYTVEMVSSNEGWSARTDDLLSYYTGNGWIQVTPPINNSIRSIKMLNNTSGWAVGNGGEILRYIE